MQVYSPTETASALAYPAMIAGMHTLFANGVTAPLRHHHTLPHDDQQDGVLLLMPAWQGQHGFGGVKIANVTPDNGKRGLPAVIASYLLFDETTGEHLAILDGTTLTARRTAAASALGARYLANPAAKHLLLVGAGKVAQELPDAFSSLFPLERISIWNRNPERAQALAEQLGKAGRWQVEVCGDLEAGVKNADIISCATLAREPLVKGEWLQAGQHLDLIGSFTTQMRETDDNAMQRAEVYIDTEAALKESGELLMPLASGALQREAIRGTLYDLCREAHPRHQPNRISLFKGVGHAVEDLACAIVAYQALTGQ